MSNPISNNGKYLANMAGENVPLPNFHTSRNGEYLSQIVGLLDGKADLIGGKVPSSQLPSYVSDIVEVDTYEDLPETGASGTIYIVKDENNQQYRWGGTTYIPIGDEKAYYAVSVINMTTMGQLKAYINGINSQQLHILLDFHNYVSDAYVCTAHFYEKNDIQYCEIFDLLNSQYIYNPNGFADTDTIANYVSYNKHDIVTKQVKTTMDSVAVAGVEYYLGLQTSVSIVMPSSASAGEEFLVCFTSGSTACTLTCSLTGFSFTPSANKTSWIKFTCYNGADWLVETKEG